MSSFLQSGTGDLVLTNHNLSLVTDVSACAAQKLANRFLLLLGEWFLDTRIGLPYYQSIAVKNPNLKVLQALFTQVVLSVPGIQSIQSLLLSLNARRQASMFLQATTNEGATITGGQGNAFIVAGATAGAAS